MVCQLTIMPQVFSYMMVSKKIVNNNIIYANSETLFTFTVTAHAKACQRIFSGQVFQVPPGKYKHKTAKGESNERNVNITNKQTAFL